MEKVAELINQIKEECPKIISIYTSPDPVEVHLPSHYYHEKFINSLANPWDCVSSTSYDIELYNIINGVKFFTLETCDGWYSE